ncbi:TPA: hypothetical protein L4T43_003867 [Pseudomonas aeruginosa]|nr:hypothetical protein [Pseudomonas aeruginosa]HCR1331975.1 hypothetical protein [Pseudomonas aeruginosa]HCR1334400.1 hypothetical protein [Pseudomonas aeruginosa]
MLNSIDDVLAHWPAEEHWPVTGVRDRVADLLQRFDDLEQLHRFWTVVREGGTAEFGKNRTLSGSVAKIGGSQR